MQARCQHDPTQKGRPRGPSERRGSHTRHRTIPYCSTSAPILTRVCLFPTTAHAHTSLMCLTPPNSPAIHHTSLWLGDIRIQKHTTIRIVKRLVTDLFVVLRGVLYPEAHVNG